MVRAPRLDFADRVVAARELASDLGRFPKRQDRGAVALLAVVGEREALQPRAARPVGFEDGPHPADLISAIGEPDARCDACGVGFLAHIELETRGASFEIGRSNPAGHPIVS